MAYGKSKPKKIKQLAKKAVKATPVSLALSMANKNRKKKSSSNY
jgi:hypothetical protein